MNLTPLSIQGAWVAESPVWSDERGFFREWFKFEDVMNATGVDFSVQQSNLSTSNRGVIRGIHYSLAASGQAKWVTCVSGHIIDFVVDLRPESPTFKRWEAIDLRGDEGRAVLVGADLGHAFIALEDNSTVSYLLSSPYSPESEFDIYPMDSEININWQLELVGGAGLILSPKDASAPSLAHRLAEGKLPT